MSDLFVIFCTAQQCTFKSQVYMHDEEFSDGCAALCHCRSGRTVCRERCPSTLLIPSEQCKNPQLVVVKNECCPQWRCFPAGKDASQILSSFWLARLQVLYYPRSLLFRFNILSASLLPPARSSSLGPLSFRLPTLCALQLSVHP